MLVAAAANTCTHTYVCGLLAQAKAAMPLFNQLVDAVAADEAYLAATLAPAAAQDDFTARLLRLLVDSAPRRAELAAAGRAVVLGVHRSDYMLDAPSGGFLQVELNTIASSFGCLSTLVSRLHAATLDKLAAAAAAAGPAAGTSSNSGGLQAARLPPNSAMQGIAGAMAAAVAAQGGGGVVVMVVQPGERNAYDQQVGTSEGVGVWGRQGEQQQLMWHASCRTCQQHEQLLFDTAGRWSHRGVLQSGP